MKSLIQTINEKLKIKKGFGGPKYNFELKYVKPWTHDQMQEFAKRIYKDTNDLFELYECEDSKFKSIVKCYNDDDLKKICMLVKALWRPGGFHYPNTTAYITTYFWEYYIDDKNILKLIEKYDDDIESLCDDLPKNFGEIYNDIRKKQ